MASGGPRVPANPKPVAGPGRFTTRTDSGRAQITPTGGEYGARQAMENQAAGAPVPVGQGNADVPVGQSAAATAIDPMGAFGPSDRPGESPLAGVVGPQGEEPLYDPQILLRVLAEKWPTPWIMGMLND